MDEPIRPKTDEELANEEFDRTTREEVRRQFEDNLIAVAKMTPEEAAKAAAEFVSEFEVNPVTDSVNGQMQNYNKQELEDKIHKLAEEGRIEFAPTDRVDQYEKEIEALLEALGHPEALVTDESRFCDFIGWDFGEVEEAGDQEQRELDEKLAPLGLNGICGTDTYLVEAAALLRQRGVPQ